MQRKQVLTPIQQLRSTCLPITQRVDGKQVKHIMETGDSPRTVPTDGMLSASLRLDSRGLMSAIVFGNLIPCSKRSGRPCLG